MRIWFQKLQQSYGALEDFEGDDIEDFAGHELIEPLDEEPDNDDMSWLFPPKGPGKFKDLKKKKRGKKGKKGKKNKGKKGKKADL